MNESTKVQVRLRADNRCEYCQLKQDDSPLVTLHVEHIIPRKHGGSDDLENLALARIDRNLHKGPNLTGIDSETKVITQLYHPRRDTWSDHFEWIGVEIVGKTPCGRTTVQVLNMNSEEQVGLRLS